MLRYLRLNRGVANLVHVECAAELHRRGVMDIIKHFERRGSAVALSSSGRSVVNNAIEVGVELGLMEKFRPKRYIGTYMITDVGKAVIDDLYHM